MRAWSGGWKQYIGELARRGALFAAASVAFSACGNVCHQANERYAECSGGPRPWSPPTENECSDTPKVTYCTWTQTDCTIRPMTQSLEYLNCPTIDTTTCACTTQKIGYPFD